MRKLMLVAALMLVGVTAAHAECEENVKGVCPLGCGEWYCSPRCACYCKVTIHNCPPQAETKATPSRDELREAIFKP